MRHTRAFQDPLRPRFKGLSDEARANYDRIFGERPLPNEKDHLESYVRLETGERFDVGSANKPIEKRECQRGPTADEIEYGAQKLADAALGEKLRKAFKAPGEVHRIELNELPAGMCLKDLFEQALRETNEVSGD